MSWSLSLAAKGKDAAKAELEDKAASAFLPDSVKAMCVAAIDALPETGMDNSNTVSLATYGHFRRDGDNPGTSNMTLACQFVMDGPEAQAA